MKIDRESRTVKRFTKGNDRDSVCTISNDEQWRLFMLMVSHGGTVAASVVQNMLPIISERGNAKQRLKDKLGEIQLTFEHVAGTGYVLKEFPG